VKKISRRTSASPKRSRARVTPELEPVLIAIDRVVKSVGARWYLFGAQAVAAHGAPRATKDVDVTVLLRDDDRAPLLRAIRKGGFSTREHDAEFLATSRVIPAKHVAAGMRVDFVLGGPGLEQHFLEMAETISLPRLKLPLIRLEHLIVLKCLAARPNDRDDVRRLLRRHGDVDLDEVRRLIGMLQDDIGDASIMPVLDECLAENRLSTNKRPAIRGSRA
jgi:hypothetical protein